MRKYLTLAVAALLAAALSPAAALAGQEKLDVCHVEGDGTFHLIEVAEPAYFNAHMVHGDAPPGEPVPGMSGYVFDETCQPIEAIVEVSMEVYFDQSSGTVTADGSGLTYSFGGNVYTDPTTIYMQEYWDTYLFYVPGWVSYPVVEVNLSGVPQEILTVTLDVLKMNLDGSFAGVAWSFQQSFLAEAGTPSYAAGSFVTLPTPPLLHLAVAKVYKGSDATGDPLATGETIIGLSS